MLRRPLLLLAILAPLACRYAVADVTLVAQGKIQSRIFVLPEVMSAADADLNQLKYAEREAEIQRQRLRESVKDLAHYLEKMSGASVEIVGGRPAADEKLLPILVGRLAEEIYGPTAKSAPFKQGFRLVVSPRGVGFIGESYLATSYAIYELLDRLGCRWYMPGPMGEVIPSLPTISLPETDFSSAPGTIYRGIWYADDGYRRRNRHGGLLLSAGHALEGYVTAEERSAHPEWRAEIGGKPDPTRLKWSNPGVAEAIANRLIAYHDMYPAPTYSLSPDDGASFDESADDRALDAGDFDPIFGMDSITDRFMVLTNRVAERVTARYPDTLFGVLAYVQYTRPPIREKVHPNIVPQIAPITYSRAHPMTDDRVPGNPDLRNLVVGWGKAARMTSAYFYGWFLAEPVAPNPMITKWGVDVPIVLENNCQFWQPETTANFESSLHALYLGCRLAWDPSLKPADIIDELHQRFYGHAAAPMAAYWSFIDQVWVDTPEYSGCGFAYLRRFTPERMAEARRLMDAAKAACHTPEERYRVGMADDSLALFEDFMQMRHDLAEGRFEGLDARGAAWWKQIIALGDQYAAEYAFSKMPWTPKTLGGAYFEDFYLQTYNDAARVARDFQIVTPTLRQWRFQVDEKKAGESAGWAAADFDDSGWKTTDPCIDSWSALGYHNYMGSMWYRTAVDLPRPAAGKRTYLWVSATDGSVKVLVNGRHVPFVNGKGEAQPEFSGYCQPASFDITPALQPGTNQIALFCTRTFLNELGTGGLLGPVAVYQEK